MNCRPGDIAVVVKPGWVEHRGQQFNVVNPGTVVRVVRLENADVWQLEEPIPFKVANPNGSWMSGEVEAIGDSYLRPIRPGDVTDDEVRELFAPRDATWSPKRQVENA